MSDYKKIVVNTKNYSVEDMLQGTQPICDTKILEGNEWSFSQDELPATVYYKTTSVEVPKVYTFASDEDHVEMASGRTLREEYMGVLKTMGKEFVSTDGNPIEVNNGVEARLINAEIKGQTVNSISYTNKLDCFSIKFHEMTVEKDGWLNFKRGTGNKYLTIKTSYTNLQPNTNYTLVVEVDKLEVGCIMANVDWVSTSFVTNLAQKIKTTGIHRFNVTTKDVLESNAIALSIHPNYEASLDENAQGRIRVGIYPEGYTGGYVHVDKKGLNSTQAIISNNGQQYPIYASEEDKANKQVISLGGVGDVQDTFEIKEDGSAIYTQNTKLLKLDGTQDVVFRESKANTMRFSIPQSDSKRVSGRLVTTICDSYASNTFNTLYTDDVEGICQNESADELVMRIDENKITPTNSTGLKEYLKNNPINVIYQIKTPIITTIPKEIVPTIRTHNQTNILDVGGAVKPSSFKVTVPTTDGIKKEYTLTPINGWKGTAKANLLQTGDVGLVLDLTIPSSFNVAICSLATELRPKAERTVLGYNGNTPVVVKIGTDGTIKLPISTTGTVKLDDTYKL